MKIKKILYTLVAVLSPLVLLAATVQAQGAQLFLSTDQSQVEVESQLAVTVNVNTTQNTLGTDVVVKYDPNSLELVSVTPGDLYQDFSDTNNILELAKSEGKVTLSGVADLNTGTVANGVFATLNFVPLTETTTQIEILYDETDSTLSGIIPFEGNEVNILTEAPQPLEIEVVSNNFFNRMWIFIKEIFAKN